MGKTGTSSHSEQAEHPVLLQVLLAMCLGTLCSLTQGLSSVCLLQIDASSLIAASVMAAPCALAMSKLVYPEVEESKFKGKESVRIASG